MKKALSLIAILLVLTGCGGSGESSSAGTSAISFEAYVREGETFTFNLDPKDAVTYEELRNNEFRDTVSVSNWRSYFDVREVYREHYEYDEQGNRTDTYMRGNFYAIVLLDKYYYVDNWSRNGLEFELFLDGKETRTMTSSGKVYDPETVEYFEVRDYYGADSILILSDFENVWDEETNEKYTGQLNDYDMVSVKGDLYLLDASVVNFRKYKDDIYCFAAYDSPQEYFIILIQTDDQTIDREKEYEGAVYYSSGNRINERYTGYTRIMPWAMIIELMSKVNEQ